MDKNAQFAALLESVKNDMAGADNRYIDDLIGQSQGDMEFILRKLDSDHKIALGTDDGARAAFFEKVADSLEARIGRIPYDYERYTTRELQDLATGTERITSSRDLVLKRLDEDEQIVKTQLNTQQKEDTQITKEGLNARGMVSSGVAEKDLNTLSSEYDDQRGAIERALGRQRFDTKLGAANDLFDLNRGSTRTMEDIKVDARRGGQDAQNDFTFGSEGARRDAEARKKALERQRAVLDSTRNQSAFNAATFNMGYS